MSSATSFYDFEVKDSAPRSSVLFPFTHTDSQVEKGKPYALADLKGKVVLVVNTATACGLTPQLAGLESLYKKLKASHPDQFTILGFPCNQFNNQNALDDNKTQEFCQINYGVSFPILGKTEVNGPKAEPVFEYMKGEKPRTFGVKRVLWNFEKFLIGADGEVKQRWHSTTKPQSLEQSILEELKRAEKKNAAL